MSTPNPNILQAAVNCLRSGRMAEAESLCHQLLGQRPNDFDALHLLGLIAAQTGRSERAVELLEQAIRQRDDVAPAYNTLGNALRDLKRGEEAVIQYSRALALRPGFPEAHLGRSAVLLDLRRPAESLADADAAIALRPGSALAHLNRGAALHELKRSEAAAESFQSSLALNPGDARAHYGLALALQRSGRPTDSLRSAEAAIELDPTLATAHNLRAATLLELLRPEEALVSAERAIALQPDYALAYVNEASALLDLQRAADALDSVERAISLQPQLSLAHMNRGIALQALTRSAEALVSLEQAARLDPGSAEAHFNWGLCHLQLGQYPRGFELYEWRCRIGRQTGLHGPPLWTGREPIAGKTIVLRAEQGLGDTVQFARFARVVEQLGARVVLSIQRDLREVLRSLGPSIEVVDDGSDPHADFQCLLASVPHALNLNAMPAEVPYLSADPDRLRHWRARLGAAGYKVGICWQGSRNKIDLGRSIPLQHFATLAQVPGVRLISLQKGYGTEQLASLPPQVRVEIPADGMGPEALQDLVAVMSNLDLVITSDTLVAHLAGALALPTWVALKHSPDWRWMLERADSPWYPTARLFRQKRSGDWSGVLADIHSALSARLASQ